MTNDKKILLLGYMASGKSSVGKELALVLGYKFKDLDAYIEKKEGITVTEIFETKGETYFRKKEKKYVKKLLKSKKNFVLSLGGGTPQIEGVMKLINKRSLSFYLKAKVNTLYNRLTPNEVERPILTKITEDYLFDYIKSHLKKREDNYEKATYTIEIDNLNIEDIVRQIITQLKKIKK